MEEVPAFSRRSSSQTSGSRGSKSLFARHEPSAPLEATPVSKPCLQELCAFFLGAPRQLV